MAAATPTCTLDLIDLLKKSRIWPDAELESRLEAIPPVPEEASRAAAHLIKHGLLTTFQARVLLTGKYRGFRLGAYVIRDQIGQGGMGSVFLAQHETLRRPVAIKVLAAGEKGATSKVNVERFLREARSAAALDHPNIVRIFDVAQLGETHYLVMEYVEGQTLDQMLTAGGPVACGRAVEYVLQAAAGLEHASQKGFIHRDIKPANLILAKDGTLKILDMGLARSEETEDKVTEVFDKGAVVGTADFISPEQAMNAPDLDIRTDIYSLGATFYTLVTGKPPFRGNTTQKLMQHQIKDAPPLDSLDKTFPPDLSRVVAKMMKKRPADRYQTPNEVMAALGPWLSNTSQVISALSLSRSAPGSSASSADLQHTLNEVVSGSTKRLNDVIAKAAAKPQRSLVPYVVAGVAGSVLMLAAFVGLAVYAFSGSTDKAAVAVSPPPAWTSPAANPAPGPTTPPATRRTPAAPAPATKRASVFAFDAAGLVDFREQWKSVPSSTNPGLMDSVVLSTTGDGKLPEGWQRSNYQAGTVSEVAVESVNGAKGLSLGTLEGGRSTMIFTSVFPVGQPTLKLKIEYLIEGTEGSALVKFAQTAPDIEKGYWGIADVPATNGQWAIREFEFDTRGASKGRLEFHTPALEIGKVVWIKSISVTSPGPEKTQATAGLRSTVFNFDAANLVAFRETWKSVPNAANPDALDQVVASTSGAGTLPDRWMRMSYKAGTVSEVAAEVVGGKTALGVATLDGAHTTMLFTPMFTVSRPTLRVKIEYLIEGTDGTGQLLFAKLTPTSSDGWSVAELPATDGKWATREFDFDPKGATSGRFEFHTHTMPDGKMTWVKSVAVTEATPATVAAPPAAADAGPRSVVNSFDAGSLANFREQFRSSPNKAKPGTRENVVLGRSGGGKLSADWWVENYRDDTVSEVAADTTDGVKALGLTTLEGYRSTMLHTPPFASVAAGLRLKIEYMVEGTEGHGLIRFVHSQPWEGTPAADLGKLPASNGQWVTREFPLDGKTSTQCRFEFHTSTLPLGKTLWIKSYAVTAGGPATTQAPAPAADALAAGDKVLLHTTFDKLKPYRERSTATRLEGAHVVATVLEREGDGRLTPEWGPAWSWSPAAVQEFTAAVHNGSMALGFRTVSGVPSTMLFCPRVDFTPGTVRIKVEYAISGTDGGGLVRHRQVGPNYGEVWDVVSDMTATDGEWRTADSVLDTRQATAGVVEFHTTNLPVGVTFWLKSVTVYQPAE